MCKLVNKSTNEAKERGDVICDAAGRFIWSYVGCDGAAHDAPPLVHVRRLTNGKPSVRPMSFTLEFFPEYRVSVAS